MLCVAQLLAVVSVLTLCSALLPLSLIPTSRAQQLRTACALGIVVTAINYFSLRFGSRWRRFEPEFESYSPFARRAGGFAVAGLLLLILVAAVYTKGQYNHLVR